MEQTYFFDHPLLGVMALEGSHTSGITRLRFLPSSTTAPEDTGIPDPLLLEAASRLKAYFLGDPVDFSDLLLCPQGTDFQQAVWQVLRQVPLGSTCSYQWIAERIGRPRAVRAVGQANKNNPLPILIPCHRVIRHNGDLGGYIAGQFVKQYLLNLEQHQTVFAWPNLLKAEDTRQTQAMTLL